MTIAAPTDAPADAPLAALRPLLLMALPLLAIPLLPGRAMAATPLASDGFLPFNPPASATFQVDTYGAGAGAVETFDPVGRAQLLARDIPREWVGTYQPFDTNRAVPAELRLTAVTAFGQIVDLRGDITIDGTATPIQGNLNAESDQLDLLLLCRCNVGGLEMGGAFSGQQGFLLSGWNAPRLTNPGGRLDLRPRTAFVPAPAPVPAGVPVRGMW
ncbi:hypothetical protein [Cyanobium sp. PCC 7001]|uniref:hypothetical protein n=1 Tax=Cyanobium sp. PCC 7001 TaxID=180281 RepID=UPI001CECAB09|nr:hypothetical protein [Cyanobium sp. PCC 7001]